jgi:hypothetical protein
MKISNKLSENIIDEQRFYEALNTLVNDIENVSSKGDFNHPGQLQR